MKFFLKSKPFTIMVLFLITVGFNASGKTSMSDFPLRSKMGNRVLSQRGVGVLRYMLVIRAYKGAFYLDRSVKSSQALGDYAKHLELVYFHKIDAEKFVLSTRKMIAKNISDEKYKKLLSRIEKINSLYKSVKPGDSYSITYIPGRGTTLSFNGNSLGTIKGYDFSYAIFSIWLGKSPIDEDMKKQLLGKSSGGNKNDG